MVMVIATKSNHEWTLINTNGKRKEEEQKLTKEAKWRKRGLRWGG